MFCYKQASAIALPVGCQVTLWVELAPTFVTTRMVDAALKSHPEIKIFRLGSLSGAFCCECVCACVHPCSFRATELYLWLRNHKSTLSGARSLRVVCTLQVVSSVTQLREALREHLGLRVVPLLLLGPQYPPSMGDTVATFTTTDMMRASEFAVYLWPLAK